ncbi:MAG: HU family DNA-binding protein [Desulfobulbaceae bacterium]
MNKGELADKVAKNSGLSKSSAQDAVNTVLGAIADALTPVKYRQLDV